MRCTGLAVLDWTAEAAVSTWVVPSLHEPS